MSSSVQRGIAVLSGMAFLSLTACGGGGGSGASPSPTPTPSGGSAAAYTCPTSDSVASVARGGSAVASGPVRRMRPQSARTSKPSTVLLAVTYDRTVASASAASIAARETAAGATSARTLDFPHVGLTTHILTVPAAKSAMIEAALRAQTGVKSVAATGYQRHLSTVNAAYYPNDPYFNGFGGYGTYRTPPYDESSQVAGQWDMHATKLEYAFEYSQPSNGSSVSNANALGSSAVKIAIIDTGEDATHPELASKIAYQKCFITALNGAQSTSNFASDPMGHGTDVAGIAAEATNNDLGFTAAGGNAVIYGYRVFPTPDDSCANESNQDDQCEASTADITSAIVDATAQHVDVISMSLGGDECTAGADPDPVEGAAVQDAIAAGIIVVAAAGNDYSAPLEAPACDTGVIAVGASALGDGNTNGSGSTVGSANAPAEYVASYSNWGTPAASAKSASAWGIVAPGGDPSGDNDNDYLHWVSNIWTSKPYDANFDGECTNDFPNNTSTTQPDCRVLIAGTSQATPHVAGAAALILSVNSAYKSAAAMKTLLCTTADDIGAPHEGCGRLNIYRAMAKALNDPNLP